MTVGLGTGSTVYFTLAALAERIAKEGLAIRGVPTSVDTQKKALEMGIPMVSLSEAGQIDLTIDGADEIDPEFRMVKGGGGALLREKVVASLSTRELIVVHRAKLVQRLGDTFLVPVELVPFARSAVQRHLQAMGALCTLRMREKREPFLTDNGNEILDCRFESGMEDPAQLEGRLNSIPGVVENGLFIGLAHGMAVGDDDGEVEVRWLGE